MLGPVRRASTVALLGALLGAGPADPPLIDAVREADREAVRALIGRGEDVDAAAGDGSTALLWASHLNDLEAAKLLIEAGADVDAANDNGATPLWAASMNANLAMVELLLGADANPNDALLLGETPLMIAARGGDARLVETLLEHGADPNQAGFRNQTPLMWAAGRGNAEAVAVLVEHGADVHTRTDVWNQMMAHGPVAHPEHQRWFDHGGNTALMFAARVGSLESAKHLVAAGADVNDANAWGVTVLTMAVYANFGVMRVGDNGVGAEGRTRYLLAGQERFPHHYEDPALIDFLVAQGADPNAGAKEFTGLHAAIMHRNERVVELLLEHGADPNLPLGTWTPERRLSYSDYYFHKAWVGAPPLWLAARFGTPAMMRMLVERGADPTIVHTGVYYGGGRGGVYSERQEEVSTVLMAALELPSQGQAWVPEPPAAEKEAQVLEKVELLIELGVDVNAADPNGRTALDAALRFESEPVIQALKAAGAREGTGTARRRGGQ